MLIWDKEPLASPEIAVSGNSLDITTGGTIPSATDDTEFGCSPVGTLVMRTFTLTNSGKAEMNVTSVDPGSRQFYVTASPTTPAGAAGDASVLVATPGGTNAANTLFSCVVSDNADLYNLVAMTAAND